MNKINCLEDIIKNNDNIFLKHIVGNKEATESDAAKNFFIENWPFLSEDIEDYGRTRRNSFARNPESPEIAYKGAEVIPFNGFADILIRTDAAFRNEEYNFPNANEKLKKLEAILCSDNIPMEIKEKMAHFYHLSQTRANFIPLPSPEFYSGFNMEQQRSSSKFNNMTDLFIKAIADQVDFSEIADIVVEQNGSSSKPSNAMGLEIENDDNFLTKKCNLNYFKKFASFDDFVEKNFLQDIFKDSTYKETILLSPSEELNNKTPYKNIHAKKLTEETIDAIYREISPAIDNAIDFICKRGERLNNR